MQDYRPPKSRCSRPHIADKRPVRIAKAAWLIVESSGRLLPEQSHDYPHPWLTKPIACCLWSQRKTTVRLVESSTDLFFWGNINSFGSLVKLLIDVHL